MSQPGVIARALVRQQSLMRAQWLGPVRLRALQWRRRGEIFSTSILDVHGCTDVKEIAWPYAEVGGHHVNADWTLVETVTEGDVDATKAERRVRRGEPAPRFNRSTCCSSTSKSASRIAHPARHPTDSPSLNKERERSFT